MKKDPADYTPGERKFADLVAALKAGKPNAHQLFKNLALTEDGDLLIGMSYSIEWERYSCSAVEVEGVRTNDTWRWDRHGGSLDGGSDLNLASVHDDVKTF